MPRCSFHWPWEHIDHEEAVCPVCGGPECPAANHEEVVKLAEPSAALARAMDRAAMYSWTLIQPRGLIRAWRFRCHTAVPDYRPHGDPAWGRSAHLPGEHCRTCGT